MRFLLTTHALLGVFAAALTYFFAGPQAALSLGVGAVVMFANLIVLGVTWQNILAKKLVALSVGVIVFKFAILIWIIYIVATSERLYHGWFAGGLALIVVSSLATALKYRD